MIWSMSRIRLPIVTRVRMLQSKMEVYKVAKNTERFISQLIGQLQRHMKS